MEKTRRYEFEGISLEIPLRYDVRTGQYLEQYPDFIQNPVYTPAGYRVLFSGEDACPEAEAAEGESCPDCGSCRFYHPAGKHTWFGVCKNEQHCARNRKNAEQQRNWNEKEESK